jgi:hypothetical protein
MKRPKHPNHRFVIAARCGSTIALLSAEMKSRVPGPADWIGSVSLGKGDFWLIDEDALRKTLVALVGLVKAQYKVISALGMQQLAMQETVKGLDPTFTDVMEAPWREEFAARTEIGQLAIEVYDDLIERLKEGEVC